MHRHRKDSANPAHSRARDRAQGQRLRNDRIHEAVRSIGADLKHRPPESVRAFEDMYRAIPYAPERRLQEIARSTCLEAGRQKFRGDGEHDVIARTRARVEAMYAELCADALSYLPHEDDVIILEIANRETREQCEADVAVNGVLTNPDCPELISAAIVEITQHENVLIRMRRWLSARSAQLGTRTVGRSLSRPMVRAVR